MLPLYPEIAPNQSFFLPVGAGHELYVEECGNPRGLPVLFLHGGPGAGCEPWQRRFFDPTRYRIMLFDQRGAGKSRPHASLDDNTTPALIADIETIRTYLGIERWLVFGGSWGATLALAYAEAHPDRVLAMILRGIFLCREQEIRWFYQDGAHRIFPDYWADFIAPIPEAERGDLVQAHYRRLTGNDEVARMASAKAWSVWEGRAATLEPKQSVVDFFGTPRVALALARIEAHYFVNNIFLAPDQLLRDTHRLAGIPGVIVHGRYDMVCPVENAFDLARAWPDARLEVIPAAGHSASEPRIVHALVSAMNTFARQFAGRT